MIIDILCEALLHSLEFDRLRSIRQLGCSHYVFPGAKHSRFEHSVVKMPHYHQHDHHLFPLAMFPHSVVDSDGILTIIIAINIISNSPGSSTAWE